MADGCAYTPKQITLALNLSAALGWFGYALPTMLASQPSNIIWIAVIGLPTAYTLVWLIGGRILTRVLAKPVTWISSAFWGASIASAIAAFQIVVGRLLSFLVWAGPNASSEFRSGFYVTEVDGILTLYGWWLVAKDTAFFVAVGTLTGVLVRAVIGPGKSLMQQERVE